MLGAAARFLPAIRNFTRQIVPPVVATLLAAVLIAGYNRAFTGHLVQPRMAAMHSGEAIADDAPRPASLAKPREVTDAIVVAEPVNAQNRVFSKGNDREAAKDEMALKTAALPAAEPAAETTPDAQSAVAQPATATAPTPPVVRTPKKVEPRAVERRPAEPRPYGSPVIVSQPPVIVAQPPIAAPASVIATAPVVAPYPAQQQAAPYPMQQPVAQQPPPVIAAKPMVTVPDRQRAPYPQNAPYGQNAPYPQNAPYAAAATPEQEIAAPPPPQGGPLERFVDTMKPSSIFARMRELGDKIESVGNDILPNIRQ